MSSSTSGYSLPSSQVIVRLVSIVERLRIAKSALLSLKTTGLYSGCMPFFIATFLLSVLEALQFNHEKGEGPRITDLPPRTRSEEHTSELQSRQYLVCRLLLEKKKSTHRSLVRA